MITLTKADGEVFNSIKWLNRGDLAEGTGPTTWDHSMIETALGVTADDWNLGWNRGQKSEGNKALLLVGRYGDVTRAHMALIMPIQLPDILPIRTISHMHGGAIAHID